MVTGRTKPSLAQRRCLLKECPGLGERSSEKEFFGAAWPCEPHDPSLPWAGWPQLPQAMGVSLSPVAVTARFLLLLFSAPIEALIHSSQKEEEKAVLGTGSSGVLCPTPFPSPGTQQKQKSWDAPALPLVVWVSVVADFCLQMSQRCSICSAGCGENVGQCGMGSALMLSRGLRVSEPTLRHRAGKHLHTSVTIKGKLASKWNILLLSVTDGFFIFFFNIRYTSNVISFSNLFPSFNNKTGTEKKHYHYPCLKIISISKRLIKNQHTLWPFLPLYQGIYFKHKHLLLRGATTSALTDTRWNMTLLLWHVGCPQLTQIQGIINMSLKCTFCCFQECSWLLVWASLHPSYTGIDFLMHNQGICSFLRSKKDLLPQELTQIFTLSACFSFQFIILIKGIFSAYRMIVHNGRKAHFWYYLPLPFEKELLAIKPYSVGIWA